MSAGSDEEKQTLLKTKNGTRTKLTLAVIALSNMFAWSCISLIAPFFPIVAIEKGMTETVIGFVYSCPELVIFLMSPVFGKLLARFSPKFFYIAGLFVFACCDIMYGWLDLSPPGASFIGLCFAVRIVAAVGTASMMTASFAVAGNNFPDRIGTVYGILETVSGCGFMIGPAIGGVLYELGGFGLPFWVLGALVVLCGIASFLVIPEQDIKDFQEHKGPSSLTLFRSSKVLFGTSCLTVAVLAFSVWEPVLTQQLEQFQLSQGVIGLIFVIPSATYAIATPLWGVMLDRKIPGIPVMITGVCCAAVCLLFFGPAPFFTFLEPMLWLTLLTIALLGLALAPVIVSAMRLIVEGARLTFAPYTGETHRHSNSRKNDLSKPFLSWELGFKDDSGTFGLVGGIVQSGNCLGAFSGPLFGGAFTEHYGFGSTMAVSSAFLMIPVVCYVPYLIINARRNKSEPSRRPERGYIVLKGESTDNRILNSQSQIESSLHGFN